MAFTCMRGAFDTPPLRIYLGASPDRKAKQQRSVPIKELFAFVSLFAGAGAGLPFIACLTLVAGRRGNALFCLWGAFCLLRLALMLCTAGPLWFIGSYLADVSQYGASLSQKLAPLLHAAGLPWSSSCGAWLAAWLAAAASCAFLHREIPAFQGDRYRLRYVRAPIICCLASCLLFLAAFMLFNWPFAGLPEGLTWDRAGMAIARHATRQYFMAFSPAGAFALLMGIFLARNMSQEQEWLAARWLAVWAGAGALPYIVISWGTLAGISASGNLAGALAQGLWGQTVGLIFSTASFFCWAALIWKPLYWRILAICGVILLLLKTAAPFMVVFFRQL